MISFAFIDEAGVGRKRHPKPIAYDDLTVAIGQKIHLTPANARRCVGALIKWEGSPFRVRMDGGNPIGTGTVSGYLRSDGDEYFCSREEAQMIVTVVDEVAGGTGGFMRVTYYG